MIIYKVFLKLLVVFVPFKRKIQVIKNVQEIPIKFPFVMILLNLHKEIFL